MESHKGSLARAHQASVALQSTLTHQPQVETYTRPLITTHRSPGDFRRDLLSRGQTFSGAWQVYVLGTLLSWEPQPENPVAHPQPLASSGKQACGAAVGKPDGIQKPCLRLNTCPNQRQPYEMHFSKKIVRLLTKGRV